MDDSSILRKQLREDLEKEGHQVFEAQNGESGLKFLENQAGLDLIICDVHMPILDGFQFCEEVRKKPKFQKTPIYFMSADSNFANLEKCKQLKIKAWFQKPYNKGRLITSLKNLKP